MSASPSHSIETQLAAMGPSVAPPTGAPPLGVAKDYINRLFESDDLVCFVTIKDDRVVHLFRVCKDINDGFLQQLQARNDADEHIYVCMNPLTAERRVKENVSEIRTLYLDIDHDSEAALKKVRKSLLVPPPHFILQSSPGKFYVVWRVKGILPDDQERLLGALIQEFGGDPAASDKTRVLRVPGFVNHKYDTKPIVEVVEANFDLEEHTTEDFTVKVAPLKKAEPVPEIIPDGERNQTLASLAGSLRRRGIQEPTIRIALQAVNQEQCQPPLDDSEVEKIAKSIAQYEPAETPATEVSDEEISGIAEEPIPEFPAITGSIQELAEALCPDLPREFKIMSAITRVGLALSGKVQLEGELHLQPRFYTCFIAEAGRGKTASIKETRIINEGYREIPSVDSAPALVDTFAETNDSPRHLLLSPDEAVDLFEKAKTSRDSRNSLFTEILKLYEDNVTGNRARRNEQPIEIQDAHLAILCGATPSGYDGMWMGSRGASGGLQSRFIPIVTKAPAIPARQGPSEMQRVHGAVARIHQQIDDGGPTLLMMTAEAEEAFKAWWESVPKDKPATIRVETLVKRFLMVLAVTNDTSTIDSGAMAIGTAFGDYIIAVRERFNPADAFSWVQAFEKKIEKCHERLGVPMTRDRCRKLVRPDRYPGGYGDFIRAYGNLVQAGRLTVQGKSERAPKYGLD